LNTTATKKIRLATLLAAPALATVAIGLAGAAGAHASASGAGSAQQTIVQLRDQGYRVVVNTNTGGMLDQCSVISIRGTHAHHDHPQDAVYKTIYVDAYCQPAGG
jgi:hypothetical protein